MAGNGAWTRLQRCAVAELALAGLLTAFSASSLKAQAPDPAQSSFSAIGLRGADDPPDLSSPATASADPSADALDASPVSGAPDGSASPDPTANYGKPKPNPDPTLAYPGRPKTYPNSLPALQPYATAPSLKQKGGPPDASSGGPPPPTVSETPYAIRKKPRPVEADPFAPLGIDVGLLRLTPYVETDVGFDSNPQRISTDKKGSPVLRGETGVAETSLWSTNQLTANLEAGYSDYLKEPSASRPDAAGKIDLRIDASKQTALDFELRGALSTQQPGAPGISSSLEGRPLVVTAGTTAGVTQTFSRLTLGLHGLVDRAVYQDGRLSDGTVDPLSSENYTDFTLQGRAGYEITPGVIPFTELDVDTRRHDQMLDAAGYARNSNGVAGQIGSTFEFTRLLTGSLAGGYLERTYQDARLGVLNGPTFNASLVWSVTPLTTVTLKGATIIDETTVTNASGEVSRLASLGVAHALLRNLTLTGLASYQVNTYPGSNIVEHDYLGSLGVEYSLTRSLVVKGTFTHERLLSTTPGSDYTANTLLVGLRLQR